MKTLFVVFHGFAAYSGISKKIFAQSAALTEAGADTRLCYIRIDAAGRQRRVVGSGAGDDPAVDDFGGGIRGKLLRRLRFGGLTRWIRREGIELLYVRYDHNANPALILWFRRLKALGVRIFVEVPTFPYDREFDSSPWPRKLKLAIDKLFRRRLMRYVDRVVTFSDHREIFGRPTLCISNGIDFDSIPLRKPCQRDPHDPLRLLGVANIHLWHGFDRVIEGMKRYREAGDEPLIRFDVVGDGSPALLEALAASAREGGISDRVTIYGPLSGAALDERFDACDFGIASLGRHRSGIESLKSLKNREYAARGLAFVYSERDDDFDDKPYVMKAPCDDSPLDMGALVRFVNGQRLSPAQIRASIGDLSWRRQMERVVREAEQLK